MIAGLYLAAEVSINRALLRGNAVERQKLCRRGLQGWRVVVPSLPGPAGGWCPPRSSPGWTDPALWLEQVRRGFGSLAQLLHVCRFISVPLFTPLPRPLGWDLHKDGICALQELHPSWRCSPITPGLPGTLFLFSFVAVLV